MVMNYSTDPVFQAIQHICNPNAIEPILAKTWEHWLGQTPQSIQVKPTLSYYRPFDCARIVAEVTVETEKGATPFTSHSFFNTFADAAIVRQQVNQGYELAIPPNAALPVFEIAEWQTVVWSLPHAPCLPELTELLQPEVFCPLLIHPSDLPADIADYPAPQLFRYVPFKRAILTWDSPCKDQRYFIKLCTEAEFPKVVSNFTQIYNLSDRLSFDVPEPIAADPTTRTFSMRALAGQQFSMIMRQTQPKSFEQVGRVLAELHHADLYPIATWTASKELKTFGKAMKEVKLALPHLSGAIDRATTVLTAMAERIAFPSTYPIHANLFGDQILYSPDKIGMVDWDTLSFGDPHYDVGRLIAHFIYLAGRKQLATSDVKTCIEALLQGYESKTDWAIDRTCLAWHITMQLLLRSKISSLRKLPLNWQDHLEFAVAEAEWLMAGCSEFIFLPALT
jgi:thiamine kinase-like enzyme